jgi:hypothetical protein
MSIEASDDEKYKEKSKQIKVDVCFSYDNKGVTIEKRIGTVWNLENSFMSLHNKDEVEMVVETIHDQLKIMVDHISVKDVLRELKGRII